MVFLWTFKVSSIGTKTIYTFWAFSNKASVNFPTFKKIDKSIQDLRSIGVVLAREEKLENKKIKGLYYLNPIIRSQLNKLKK